MLTRSPDIESRKQRLLRELSLRVARAEQSKRGYYDENGVRQGGLMAFIRYFWHILEPEIELTEGWALYAIIEHLEAVAFGEIRRLLITVPPGFMKSLCTDVFWPAWLWGPANQAHKRFLAFAYSASLTERDNERFRDLITSPDYRALWGDRVKPIKTGAVKVTNSKKGWKLASSVGGVGTGERADVCIIDDAHNIKDVESEIVRTETVRWFRESLSDRVNSVATGIFVVIMQRSHEDDVAGAIIDLGLPYEHLMIPMEYDWDRQTDDDGNPRMTSIGWYDPRWVSPVEAGSIDAARNECDGTLAWEERFPSEDVNDLRVAKGPYAYAGQYQQAPAPRGGGVFKRSWWQPYDSPSGKFPVFEMLIASLDSAYTEKESNDPSALTVWGLFTNDEGKRRIMLVQAWRRHIEISTDRQKLQPLANEHMSFHGAPADPQLRIMWQRWRQRTQEHWGLLEWVADTCNRFKIDKLLIEAKASGHSAAQELANRFGAQDWSVQLVTPSGDKYARALAVQPTFSQGLIYAPIRDWAEEIIKEMENFPKGKYRDLTDSATQAIKYLRDSGLAQTDEERHAAEADRVAHRPRAKALYPV